MSAAFFLKNLPKGFANRGMKLPKLACIQVRKNSNGSVFKKAEKPNTSNDEAASCYKDEAASCYKDVCVGEGVVFPKPEQMAAADAINYINATKERKSVDKAWVDNTVQEVFIHDNNVGSDIVCDTDYCVGEGVVFHKSSVEPNFAPLFDMFDKGVICNEKVCVSEGVAFSRDELEDIATKPVDEKVSHDNRAKVTTLKKNGAEDDFNEKVEVFYNELDFLDFDNSGNAGNVYWSPSGRKAVDVDLTAPLIDVFDKGMVCNESVCVSEGVVFSKDQLKDTTSSSK